MKKLTQLLVALLLVPAFILAQEETPKYVMLELTYMMPKVGMESKFVEAVKKHNEKYHEGPHAASLNYILTGEKAGWFVWIMGPLTYTDLDNAPGQGAHSDDWTKTVAPYVQKYGTTEYWKRNDDLSVMDGDSESKDEIWWVDINRGDWHRFEEFMEKINVIFEKQGDEIHVWTNQFNQDDGRDIAITWPFDNWAEYDTDDWKMSEEYDKEYGPGAWMNALRDWEEITKSIVREVWESVE